MPEDTAIERRRHTVQGLQHQALGLRAEAQDDSSRALADRALATLTEIEPLLAQETESLEHLRRIDDLTSKARGEIAAAGKAIAADS